MPKFEIGYWRRCGYERQGLVTEAVLGIAGLAFNTLGAQRVEIRCDTRNERSRSVALRAGFRLEGIHRHDARAVNGGPARHRCLRAASRRVPGPACRHRDGPHPPDRRQNRKVPMSTLTQILANIESEAKRAPFDIDKLAYRKAHRPPTVPILAAGNMESALCLFARDLGQEEVLRGQPLIGSAGRRVRKALFERLYPKRQPDPPYYTAVLNHVLLTNTVPYKPAGNVEYDRATKSRFRPFIEELLVNVWTGNALIPMGEGAFKWFAPYAEKGAVLAFWDDREARFHGDARRDGDGDGPGRAHRKGHHPGPDPSPVAAQPLHGGVPGPPRRTPEGLPAGVTAGRLSPKRRHRPVFRADGGVSPFPAPSIDQTRPVGGEHGKL